ncbi:threonine--tRNA ligase [Candidatus Dojkabacteria bacterium]|nr:threonine--tRNA ligase [Candidatus Dojkabacteria bacterium]
MNSEHLDKLRHSSAHLLAAAVLELWPDAKRAIGPSIENGFYYDFEFSKPISEEDFPKIEAKMKELLQSWTSFEKIEVSKEEALEKVKGNEYKEELINGFADKGESLTFYKSGSFEDLCRGGHVENPSQEIGAFKLLSIAGAYWRGDEKNKMLTRIYATAFPTQPELDEYLHNLEEAKKRDHRKLGKELGLFAFSDLVGSGLPLFTPKGAFLREELNKFSQGLREEIGFQRVWVPHIAKNDLYKVSGHWDKFANEWLLVKSQETSDDLVMKPMNCPHHQQIFAAEQRSYRDLPIKYMETTTVYRDEKAGELLGLSRVRSITQDDSHIFCNIEQIEQIYSELLTIIDKFYSSLGLSYRVRLSFRDPQTPQKYHGDPEVWNKAESILRKIAEDNKLNYYEGPGEAAFYGPKLDFMVTDALGREWQCATPQLDFVQPARFGLVYTDKDGSEKTPVMIHFALMGALERFISVYIEHTAGNFPAWLSYTQAVILPISSEKHSDYAYKIMQELKSKGIRAEVDSANETLGNKIRKAQAQKTPYVLVVGDKELENNNVNIRLRGGESLGEMTVEEFGKRASEKISSKALDL